MIALVLTVVAFVGGAAAVYFATERKRLETRDGLDRLRSGRQALAERESGVSEVAAKQKAAGLGLAAARATLKRDRAALDARVIPYEALVAENARLKVHLAHLDLLTRKAEADAAGLGDAQSRSDARLAELGRLYLKLVADTALKALKPGNFAVQSERVRVAVGKARSLGVAVSDAEERAALDAVRARFEAVVRAEAAREEQARVRDLAREDAKRERESREEIERAAREQAKVEEALARAVAEAQAAAAGTRARHDAEIARLRAELAEAAAKSERAVSEAQRTKKGHVYVISNLGAFGDGVFKIGMTRRKEPQDRVDELGDASVPFPFDVHLMILSENAPALENRLHQLFTRRRLNKANPRKEFFRVSLAEIVAAVESWPDAEVLYRNDEAEAEQFRYGERMSEADQDYVERVFQSTGAGAVED